MCYEIGRWDFTPHLLGLRSFGRHEHARLVETFRIAPSALALGGGWARYRRNCILDELATRPLSSQTDLRILELELEAIHGLGSARVVNCSLGIAIRQAIGKIRAKLYCSIYFEMIPL
jgi:hypothetical protein